MDLIRGARNGTSKVPDSPNGEMFTRLMLLRDSQPNYPSKKMHGFWLDKLQSLKLMDFAQL
jgi:hypothetical protein